MSVVWQKVCQQTWSINKMSEKLRKEPKMAYKKPQMVAKASAKKSYVAGCPEITPAYTGCTSSNTSCMCGPLN